jgi:hypothetical protein
MCARERVICRELESLQSLFGFLQGCDLGFWQRLKQRLKQRPSVVQSLWVAVESLADLPGKGNRFFAQMTPPLSVLR